MGARRVTAVSTVLSLGLLGGGLIGIAPADAAAGPQPIVAMQIGFQPTFQFGDAGAARIAWANLSRGIHLSMAGNAGAGIAIDIVPPTDKPLQMGDYQVVYAEQPSDPNVPTVSTDYGGEGAGFTGELDIPDLAWNASGQLTRFDIVLQGVGELSLGEPQPGTTDLGEHTLAFGAVPRGYRTGPGHQVEWIHNLGSAAESIGAPTFTGQAKADFSASASTCGTSLAAGATCSFSVGFSPTAGGPRTATMSIPIGGSPQAVALSGVGAIGTTSFSFSGTDPLDKGTTNRFTDGPDAILLSQSANVWTWTAVTPQSDTAAELTLAAPAGGMSPGVHTTSTDPIARQAVVADGLQVDLGGEVCEWMPGSITVHSFTQDARGLVTMADVDYSGSCLSGGPLTGTLQWQNRADSTPPSSPSGVNVAAVPGGLVTWTASTSGDVTHTIARVTPGTAAQSSAGGGYPLADGTGTTAHLPALTPGVWTVSVWPVDSTGNVGVPATRTVTIGTPAKPVVIASPPVNVTVTPSNGGGTFTFSPPTDDGGAPITGYRVLNTNTAAATTASSSPITVSGLKNGNPYQYIVQAITAAGYGRPAYVALTPTAGPPVAPPPATNVLPDPGFESGMGGWAIFGTGAVTRVTSPVHTGSWAAQVTSTSARSAIAGMTQNTAITNSVAAKSYTFSCWVRPSGSGLTVIARLLEYTQNFSSDNHLAVTTIADLPAGVWTQVHVSGTAVRSGERIIPQVYATNATATAGAVAYDDCVLTS
ncbi:choice-of-anchor D domain-containing protein [Leifsonia sp. EB34]|uniref:choice-of-anchor D domain-containing protein n=1 Tax=Leifsonia sp. EB34 TaxID=3156303 RepID=UPI00351923CE